jgi:cell division septal protein FtsQ
MNISASLKIHERYNRLKCMDIDIQKQPTNHVKERIFRFKPICFLRNNWLPIIIILVLLLSFVLGVWSIKSYTLTDMDGLIVPQDVQEQVSKYMEENLMGKNYFMFSSNTYEQGLKNAIPYIKDVRIEKLIPNKLEIFVSVYSPVCSAYLKEDKCYLLSSEGYILNQICTDDTQNCCTKYAEDNSLYVFSSPSVSISGSQLLIMEDISKIVKIVQTYKYTIARISLDNSEIVVTLDSGQFFNFTTSQDLDTQLTRFVAVVNDVKSDNLEFKSIDFRFERPVLKN